MIFIFLQDSETDRITFRSVYGLWIIMGAGIGVGILIMLVGRWYRIHYGAWSSKKVSDAGNANGAEVLPQHQEHRHKIISSRSVGLERSRTLAGSVNQ